MYKVRLDVALIFIILYTSFIKQIYSYFGVPYVATPGSVYGYQQLPVGNSITTMMTVVVLLSILALFFLKLKNVTKRIGYFFLLFFLSLAILVWTLLTAFDTGFVELLYESTAPLVYCTALMVVVGIDDELFRYFLKHGKWIGFVSIALSLVSYISFLMNHSSSLAVLNNSSTLVYYIQGFWLLCIWSFCGEEKLGNKIYILLGVLALLAVLFNSRSWVIQIVIWLLSYVYFKDDKKGIFKILKILLAIAIIAAIVYFVINRYVPDFMQRFFEKTTQDTRSQQYRDIFAQTKFSDFIFGKGYGFQYKSQLQGGLYSYIDNAYLLMLIRYGVSIGLTYTLVFLWPVLAGVRKRGLAREHMPVLMWLLALGGVSIYCVTTLDIKSIALAIAAGRCLYLNFMAGRKKIG